MLDINDQSMPIIYAITPTYARPVQKAELTRLCHVFLLVPNVHWILVEDSKSKLKFIYRKNRLSSIQLYLHVYTTNRECVNYIIFACLVKTQLVTNFLENECGVKYTHLNVLTPSDEKLQATDPNWLKPRGVHQRNEGLHWLRQHLRNQRNHAGNLK